MQLSDFHIDLLPDFARVVSNAVREVEADLAVLTGDFQGHYGNDVGHLREPLAEIFNAINAGDGVCAILGNHDSTNMADLLADLGANMLINESVTIGREEAEICVTGVDDVFFYWSVEAELALSEAPRSGFRIALVHTSDLAEHAARCGYALYLTGHTHGGQICLPSGSPVLTMGMPRERAVSLWRCGDMTGYTSRGVGVSCLPLRYNCPAEITLITLRRA